MKRTARKPWRDRTRAAPKALLCAVLALALSVAPAGPALAQAQRLEPPVRTAAAQTGTGVIVKGDGVTIDGAFVSKEAFLDALARAKRIDYPQADPAGPASLRAIAPSAAPAGAAAPSDATARPASYGEGMGGAGAAVQVAVIERAGIIALWAAAMDRVAYLASAPFAKNTAWLVSVGGEAYRFAFTDSGELRLLSGGLVFSIAPCWLSIAVAQHAADHAGDPIEGEGEGDAAAIAAGLSNIASQYGLFQCGEAADAMAEYLREQKQEFKYLKMQYPSRSARIIITLSRDPGPRNEENIISTTGLHYGIEYNGIVYCNVHPCGLPRDAWEADFWGDRQAERTITEL